MIVANCSEIGIKGKNRVIFERLLVSNIHEHLKASFPETKFKIKRFSGKMFVTSEKKLSSAAQKKLCEIFEKQIFGISNFYIATEISFDMENLYKHAVEMLKKEDFETFAVRTKRVTKECKLTSPQISAKVGEQIVKNLNKKVNLSAPETTLFIDIVKDKAYLYNRKIPGQKGLPVKSSGKAVVMLSGGIDSPVAAYFAMKRGLKCIFVHFHSFPYTDKASIQKVKDLAQIVTKYQTRSKLYLVPFGEIQKEIMLNTNEKYRVLLYRRYMLKITELVAKKEKCQAIVTGEALGQVASQTIQNIATVQQAASLPILRPLIGFDKDEIISIARRIETYETSILPHDDCCTRFVPKHPATRSKIRFVEFEEQNLNFDLDLEKLGVEVVNLKV